MSFSRGGALLGGDIAFEIEEQADVLEAHGGFAIHAQGAAKIEIAFGPHLDTYWRHASTMAFAVATER